MNARYTNIIELTGLVSILDTILLSLKVKQESEYQFFKYIGLTLPFIYHSL